MSIYKRPPSPKPGTSQYWWIRYWIDGKEIRESTGFRIGEVSKGYVEAYLVEKKKQIKLKGYSNFSIKQPTFEEISIEYLKYARDVAQKTSWKRDMYSLNRLSESFSGLLLIDITSKDVISYQKKRINKGVTNATINREVACLRLLFNYAAKVDKFFGKNPVSKIKFLPELNDVIYILSYEEEQKLLDKCTKQLYPIVFFALNTGMRKNEILQLKWKDVDFKNSFITIRIKDTKSKKPRKVPINDNLFEFLKNHKNDSSYVFLNKYGKPYVSQDSIKRIFIRAYKQAGIKHLRFHDLRHTVATRMIEKGANPLAVKEILGHYDFSITQKYIHPDESLRDAVNLL